MSAPSQILERERGLAYAAAWRVKNKPVFDRLFGNVSAVCPTCRRRHA